MQLPALQPDELLISWVWRFMLMSGFRSMRAAANYLIGQDEIIPPWILPRGVDMLAERLQTTTASQIIDSHTMLPLFSPFMQKASYDRVLLAMHKGSKERSLFTSLGLMRAGSTFRFALKHCDMCMAEDEARLGFSYYRRTHQIPGVATCPRHGVPLKCGCGHCRYTTGECRTYRLLGGQCMCGSDNLPFTTLILNADELTEQRRIGILAGEFLCRRHTPIDDRTLLNCYLQRADELGCHGGSRLSKKFAKLFAARYSDRLLTLFGAQSNSVYGAHWLRRMFSVERPPRNPIHHLLVVNLLFNNYCDFIAHLDTGRSFTENGRPPGIRRRSIEAIANTPASSDPNTSPTEYLKLAWPRKVAGYRNKELAAERTAFMLSVYSGASVISLATGGTFGTNVYLRWLRKGAKYHDRWRRAYVALLWYLHFPRLRTFVRRNPSVTRRQLGHEGLGESLTVLTAINPTRTEQLLIKRAAFDLRHANRTVVDRELDDAKLASVVREQAAMMRSMESRPVRITVQKLKTFIKRGGEIASGLKEYPKTRQALNECAETRVQLVERLAAWAFSQADIKQSRSRLHFVAHTLHMTLTDTESLLRRLQLLRRSSEGVAIEDVAA